MCWGGRNVIRVRLPLAAFVRLLVSLSVCAGLASCTGQQPSTTRIVRQPTPAPASPKATTSAPAQIERTISLPVLTDYRIQPMDTIQINVFNELDLSVKVRVSAQGTINYPLLGSVQVGGLTVTEAENLLKQRLGRDYLVNPQVFVLVERANSRRVFLLGQVRSPGAIEFPPDEGLTILQAIARAGGFTPIAAPNRVSIIRSENGAEKKISVNVTAIINSGDRKKDIDLRPDDVVSVPESMF
jgi:polysaccharide export outer membrane protein